MMENNNVRRPVRMPPTSQKRRKVPKWKRFLRRYGFFTVSALILAVVVLGIVLICKSCSKTPDASDFDGTYYIDDYTAYEFDGKGKGAMCLGGTTRYVFDYSVKDDTVSFDFEDMHINDITYTFALNGDTITITETSGANSYTMTKK